MADDIVKLQIRLPVDSVAAKMIDAEGAVTGDSPSAVGKKWIVEYSRSSPAIEAHQKNVAALSALRKVEIASPDNVRALIARRVDGEALTADELAMVASWIGCSVDDLGKFP